MMNEEHKVLSALVSLQVCPKHNGASECCRACTFANAQDCSSKLIANSMTVITQHFTRGKVSTTDIDTYVSEVMREIGVPAHLIGYKYVRRAITLTASDLGYTDAITKVLYPTIAKEFNVNASRVERGIRHAIEVAWLRGDLEVLQHYFGNTIDFNRGRPTNSEFIATIAGYVKEHFCHPNSSV